jgi:hypothetical protein
VRSPTSPPLGLKNTDRLSDVRGKMEKKEKKEKKRRKRRKRRKK